MKRRKRWIVLALVVAALPLAACGGSSSGSEEENLPAVKEAIEGSDALKITLTEDAAKRLAIETAVVEEASTGGAAQVSIPYAAVLYDPEGTTFTYTNPEPLVFIRQPVTVDRIEGDVAFLTEGPATGTAVVTIGAAELYGSELGIDE